MSATPISATRARLLSRQNLRGPVIEPLLNHIYERIHIAASNGEMSITHPFRGLSGAWPTTEQQEAVWEALRVQGYKVTHYPDPDPGHPGSSAYDSISWAS